MTQTLTLEQALEITQQLSPIDKLRLIESLLPGLQQEVAHLAAEQNGEALFDQAAAPEDIAASPDTIKAAIALLRSWREAGDADEQRETLAVLRAAFPADFPDETPSGS